MDWCEFSYLVHLVTRIVHHDPDQDKASLMKMNERMTYSCYSILHNTAALRHISLIQMHVKGGRGEGVM